VLVLVNLLLLPYFLFLLVIAAAAMTARWTRPAVRDARPRSRLLVLIAAHDEESGIATTVASCRSADYPESLFSVLVIADNCTDRTAAIAAETGGRVVERSDPLKRSKGYAIEYLIGRLAASGEFGALDALVVIDADTTIDPSLLRRFDAHLQAGPDSVQAYYTVANPADTWRTRLMTYGFALFNGVTQLGQTALGTSAGLRGNSMCFSTRGLSRQP
jgi:cellulose synthase/poly-beta-1,6-N-acetylglucosamine synthase-like glycosyltransferase